MAVVADEPRLDPVAVEQRARPPRVLAEDDVGLAELAQDPQRDVLEVADRRRTDDERHAVSSCVERLEADEPGADQARLDTEQSRDDPDLVPRRRERALRHDPPGRLEEEVAGRARSRRR